MKKLLLLLLCSSFAFISCKKKGCTNANATNYDSEAKKDDGSCVFPTPATEPVWNSLLCDGIQGNNDYWPLMVGYYQRIENIYNTSYYYSTVEIIGTQEVNGVTYFESIFILDEQNPSQNSDTSLIRKASNGDIYQWTLSGEYLLMSGTPAIGQTIENGGTFYIKNLNATYTTDDCTYTGLIEASTSLSTGYPTVYYKKGIGKVVGTDNSGTHHLIEFHQ